MNEKTKKENRSSCNSGRSGAYCGSSIARAFNAKDYVTACKRFNENAEGKPQRIYAKDYYDKKNQKLVYKSLP